MGYLVRMFYKHVGTTFRVSITVGGVAAILSLIWDNFFEESLSVPYVDEVLTWTFFVFGALSLLHVIAFIVEALSRYLSRAKSIILADFYPLCTGLILLQMLTLFTLGYYNDWFPNPEADWGSQITVGLIIVDTILKGVLLDFMESFDLDVSTFKPERGAFALKLTVFVFRSLWSVVFAAFLYVAFNRWRSALR